MYYTSSSCFNLLYANKVKHLKKYIFIEEFPSQNLWRTQPLQLKQPLSSPSTTPDIVCK